MIRFFTVFCLILHTLALADFKPSEVIETDLYCVGTGFMSANAAVMVKVIAPHLRIRVDEKLDQIGAESSNTLHNAGTGHRGFCELNYTTEKPDGSIDISKAQFIAEQYEVSEQFWAYLVNKGLMEGPQDRFIRAVPHMSWVQGAENVDFLKRRYKAMVQSPLFAHMEYSEDPEILKKWLPLMMQGQDFSIPMAATRSHLGTDVDFGKLTRLLFRYLLKQEGTSVFTSHEVRALKENLDGTWNVTVRDLKNNKDIYIHTKAVFVGAGGGTLKLLQRAGIEEAKGYAGFPVGGAFLVSRNADIAIQQVAKVYGRAALGAPPMSVPHLDYRELDGKPALTWGPKAIMTGKTLKGGWFSDLLWLVTRDNLWVYLKAAFQNPSLIWYLLKERYKSRAADLKEIQKFFPTAKKEDWLEMVEAGIRVQLMKDKPGSKNVLQFGTELIVARTLVGLLGASPGASTAPSISIDTIERSFHKLLPDDWRERLVEMIPSYERGLLSDDPELLKQVRAYTAEVLELVPPEPGECEALSATLPSVPKMH